LCFFFICFQNKYNKSFRWLPIGMERALFIGLQIEPSQKINSIIISLRIMYMYATTKGSLLLFWLIK
jgi:hypothetical protein